MGGDTDLFPSPIRWSWDWCRCGYLMEEPSSLFDCFLWFLSFSLLAPADSKEFYLSWLFRADTLFVGSLPGTPGLLRFLVNLFWIMPHTLNWSFTTAANEENCQKTMWYVESEMGTYSRKWCLWLLWYFTWEGTLRRLWVLHCRPCANSRHRPGLQLGRRHQLYGSSSWCWALSSACLIHFVAMRIQKLEVMNRKRLSPSWP